jgi:hypothetical protein
MSSLLSNGDIQSHYAHCSNGLAELPKILCWKPQGFTLLKRRTLMSIKCRRQPKKKAAEERKQKQKAQGEFSLKWSRLTGANTSQITQLGVASEDVNIGNNSNSDSDEGKFEEIRHLQQIFPWKIMRQL